LNLDREETKEDRPIGTAGPKQVVSAP
jgi:hypothetical protein